MFTNCLGELWQDRKCHSLSQKPSSWKPLIGGWDNPIDGNVVSVSTLKFVVTFDKTFGEGKLYHNGELVADDDDITFYIHKKEVNLTGTA